VTLTQLSHPALAQHDPRVVRWELFIFSDVRDVLPTSRPDAVVVVHRGPAQPAQWLAALQEAGMLDMPIAPDAAA
jgi:protein-L-isoaspartate O-methyltransferase